MKVLVLEENYRVSKIYQRILAEKNIECDLIKKDIELEDKIDKNYDLVIISSVLPQTKFIINKIGQKNSKRSVFLSSYYKEDENLSSLVEKTREIVVKPFAFLTLIVEQDYIHQKDLILQ